MMSIVAMIRKALKTSGSRDMHLQTNAGRQWWPGVMSTLAEIKRQHSQRSKEKQVLVKNDRRKIWLSERRDLEQENTTDPFKTDGLEAMRGWQLGRGGKQTSRVRVVLFHYCS